MQAIRSVRVLVNMNVWSNALHIILLESEVRNRDDATCHVCVVVAIARSEVL